MDRKQRFFIYDRKEVFVLLILALLVAGFAFTLGVHLGKRIYKVEPKIAAVINDPVATEGEPHPSRPDLVEQRKGVENAVEEALSRELHDEVSRTGIKLETGRQMKLPKSARSKNKGATTPQTSEYQGCGCCSKGPQKRKSRQQRRSSLWGEPVRMGAGTNRF